LLFAFKGWGLYLSSIHSHLYSMNTHFHIIFKTAGFGNFCTLKPYSGWYGKKIYSTKEWGRSGLIDFRFSSPAITKSSSHTCGFVKFYFNYFYLN
jgi:hypothetical protein